MDGRRLILNNGMVIENGTAGLAEGSLWLWLPELTIAQVATIVFDSNVMQKIIFQYGEDEDVYNDYTACMSIIKDGNIISVCMVKE